MSAWTVVPCLAELRSELNRLCPDRDHASDGTIGDAAHSPGSDHTPDEDSPLLRDRDPDRANEVHALDLDVVLRTPGVTMERVVQHVLALARAGDQRLTYVIYNRRIWTRNSGWREERYTGDSPHTAHAHFSASYAAAQERRTDTWYLEELRPVTAPTAAQNADAVAAKDVDPGAGTYSAAGAWWTTLARTAQIGPLATLVATLDARVQDQEDELDAIGASMVLVFTLVGQVTNEPGIDPNPWYDIAKQACAAALAEASQ